MKTVEIIGKNRNPIYNPCQTTDAIRSGRFAPQYWATNVTQYAATPCGKQNIVKCVIPAGMHAANASLEYHARYSRSMKCIILHDDVEIIKGRAIIRSSFAPQG